MSDKAQRAGDLPFVGEVPAGEHFWCACGRSGSQPFCDGSHAGSAFTPLRFENSRPQRMALCTCKHTGTPPWCDGSHKHIRD